MTMSANSDNLSEPGDPVSRGPADDAAVIDAEVISEEVRRPGPDPQGDPERTVRHAAPSGQSRPTNSSSIVSRIGWSLALLAGVFIGGVVAEPYLRESLVNLGLEVAEPEQSSDAVNLAPISARIDALEGRMARLEEQPQSPASTIDPDYEARLTTLESALDRFQEQLELMAGSDHEPGGAAAGLTPEVGSALEARTAALESALAQLAERQSIENPEMARLRGALALSNGETEALKGRISDLETRIAALASGQVSATPEGRILLGLTRARDKAFAGQSYTIDLEAVRADLAVLSPALASEMALGLEGLIRLSEQPLVPYATLASDFSEAARAAKRAHDAAEGSVLAGLFTTRNTSGSAQGIDALLNRAEGQVARRDLAGATETLLDLGPEARAETQSWSDAARTFVSVTAAFDRLILRLSGAAQ